MKNNYIFLGALALATSSFAADFTAVYRLAVENDSTFAEARAKFEAAQEKVPQGRAGLLPNISISANTTANRNDVENRSTQATNHWNYNSNGYTLSLTQPLFRWQNWVGYDQSKLVVAQAEAAFTNARQDLILRTAQAFFDALQARENLIAAQAYKRAVTGQLDIARNAFGVGTGIKTDVHDAEARFEMASSQVIAAETELEIRQRVLENITGTPISNLPEKRADAKLNPPEPPELAKWLEAAEQGNLTVQQQRLATEIASREVERQRGGHYPTLDLVASTGNNSMLNSGAREITDASKIGLQLTIPIFQGGEVSSRTDEAAANRRVSLAALETARRGAMLATRQSHLGVVNGLAQIRTMETGLTAARNALTSNKDAFDVGVRLNIDVLNAQNQVFSAQRDLNRITVETLMAQLKLKAAVGTLGEADVQSVNAFLATSAAPVLAGTSWQLIAIQSMDDTQGTTRIAEPSRFTLQFGDEGRAILRLDCNRGSGSWEAKPASAEAGTLSFGPIGATRALCQTPNLDARLARDLGHVRSYLLKDGKLFLSLMADGGIYEWAPHNDN